MMAKIFKFFSTGVLKLHVSYFRRANFVREIKSTKIFGSLKILKCQFFEKTCAQIMLKIQGF